MTDERKMELIRSALKPDTISDDELTVLLEVSKGAILNRRYPFGYPEGIEVPARYEHIQLQICVEMFSKKGAEGQTSHSENGISRSYECGDISNSLLNKILPMVGSVNHEEF